MVVRSRAVWAPRYEVDGCAVEVEAIVAAVGGGEESDKIARILD